MTRRQILRRTALLVAIGIVPLPQALTAQEPVSAGVASPDQFTEGRYPFYTGTQADHNTRSPDPYSLLEPVLSPSVPLVVRPHSRDVLTDIEDRAFFDAWAWQTFIGLAWPAATGLRGVPDPAITAENFHTVNQGSQTNPSVPVVWETFRPVEDAFPNPAPEGPPPAQPAAWNDPPHQRPIRLTMMSKGGGLNSATPASPTNQVLPSQADQSNAPLIDQNRQYVRFDIRVNEVLYEYVRQNKWYLKENLPKAPSVAYLPPLPYGSDGKQIPITQPETNTVITQPIPGNLIEVIGAWRILITEPDPERPWRKVDDLSRYYWADAEVSEVVAGQSEPVTRSVKVGLVAMHLRMKTPTFVQGIWASFSQVDNFAIEEGAPAGLRPSFNNGDGTFYPSGYSYVPALSPLQPEAERNPVEVSQVWKIPDTPRGTASGTGAFPDGYSTVGLNSAFRKLLAGTVWANYQLLITQWPTNPSSFYGRPFLFPRGFQNGTVIPVDQPRAVHEAYERARSLAEEYYPRFSALPIPQVGCLNPITETYLQNPPAATGLPLESTSCMGCHYAASDMDYSWILKLRTWPQPFNQGRIDNEGVVSPGRTP